MALHKGGLQCTIVNTGIPWNSAQAPQAHEWESFLRDLYGDFRDRHWGLEKRNKNTSKVFSLFVHVCS